MNNPIFVPELRELINQKKFKVIKSFLKDRHPREIAEYIGLLYAEEIWKVFSLLDNELSAEIFSYLEGDVQVALVSVPNRNQVRELLMNISHDDRADLFLRLDKDHADRLLVLLPLSERSDILKLTSFMEQTAGAIMTTDFATLNVNDVAEKAIRKLRRESPSKETIYYVYVTDDDDRLIGFVSLRKLILARPRQKIGSIMKQEMIFVHTSDDQETCARLIDEYDLLALPVTDAQERLVGIVTYDDAIDILREEQTEDMEKLMAISGGVEEKTYLDVPAFTHFKKRAFWVLTLGVLGLFTGLIVEAFQETLQALIILSFYIPLLNAAGGNTGSQSATVVLRALTLSEITPGDFLKVIQKEFFIASGLSIALGLITFTRVYMLPSATAVPSEFTLFNVSLVIGISVALQVLWATIFGALVPLGATRVKIDPAVVSSPLLTTFVDMGGIVIYFTTAHLILGI